MSQATGSAEQGQRVNHTMVLAAMLLAMAVTALEQTVVSTAMPSIIAQFKGLDIYPWVFSAYLLAATVTTPLYGKLADLWGRKPVLLFGLGLFTLGSMLSGQSRSMGMLIAMRVLQGLGAGAVGPIVLTLLGDLFTLKERAKVQSLFSAVWGVSSLAGPALGGYLTVNLSWRWVFYVSVPFGLISMFILWRYVEEPEAKTRKVASLDWLGALLLAGGTASLLLSVLEGPKSSGLRIAFWLVVGFVLLVLFVWQERRAVEPMLHLDLLFRGPILAALVGSFMIGGLLFGMDTYIPLYVQGVLGGNAWVAGKVLTPLFLAWAVSVFLAANVAVRLGFRTTAIFGSVLIGLGTSGLIAATYYPVQAHTIFQVSMVVIGLGMGPTSLSQILGVQNVVPWERRGAATAAVTFFRTIGGAMCVGLLGASLSFDLSSRLDQQGAGNVDVSAALRPETHDQLAPEKLAQVRTSLAGGLTHVYLEMFGLALIALYSSSKLAHGHETEKKPVTESEAGLATLAALEA